MRHVARHTLVLVSCAILLLTVPRAYAQEAPPRDSLKTYDLSEIVIGGQARQDDRSERVFRVDLATLSRQDVPDVASTLRLLPSANVQTNSRGETLVYIRSAGERQVAVFMDGAPMNVAWDNRIDLSLVPSTVIGSMSVERGAVGPGYGPNVSGGAVNLQSRRLSSSGTLSEMTVQGGSAGARQIRGLHAFRSDSGSLLIGGTFATTDGMVLPNNTSLPYEPTASRRVNTDRSESNLFLRLDRDTARGRIGLTLMHATAEKGVAPEGHLDPAEGSVRYWRYPLWQHSMAILNGIQQIAGVQLSGTAWVTRFRQDIEDHTDVSYSVVSGRQEDRDLSGGFRMVGERGWSSIRLRAISMASLSGHRQREKDVSGTQAWSPDQLYRSMLHTLGVEVTSGDPYPGHWALGAAWDGMTTPETGDFPSPGSFHAASLNAEWHRRFEGKGTLKLNAGSKPRFPTMRELFGTALDRFILNSDLKPERTWMAEAGWSAERARWAGEILGFVQRTTDTIDQVNVMVNGDRKRQRINLDGSRVVGAEGMIMIEPGDLISLQGHVTWMRPVALDNGEEGHLTEKPEVLATVTTRIQPRRGISVDITGIYTGKAYGLGVDNSLESLPTSLRLNFRASVSRYFSDAGLFGQLYAGVDNATDQLHLSQLGLPSEGRTARIGLSLSR